MITPSRAIRERNVDWDERYAGDAYLYGTEPNAFLAEQAGHLPTSGSVLCLAEGEGRNAVFLAEQGHAVTAVDASANALAKARRLADDRGVHLETVVADLAGFDLGEAHWSGIVSIFAHTPPALRAALHAEVARALVPGGVFLLEAYTPDQVGRGTGGPGNPAMTMTLEGLRAELPGLDIEFGQEIEREVHEGQGHSGTGAVVQLRGRRPGGP